MRPFSVHDKHLQLKPTGIQAQNLFHIALDPFFSPSNHDHHLSIFRTSIVKLPVQLLFDIFVS